jgi:hypothetical protein
MSAYFLKSGNIFRVSSKEAMDLHDALPGGNYVIKEDQFGNMFLEHIDDFEFKGKRYGDNIHNADRIINTFLDRPSSTGVLLTGEKGSGKTLLAKNVCMQAKANYSIPTIVINAPWAGDKFNAFLQTIEQPCIVLFDEFEKVYDSDEQEHILTLLDGVFPSKKLFILTCNDKWRIDSHMRNRPGRIFYMMDFKGLDSDFIREYCMDNLNDKKHIEKICNIAVLFNQFNFDMLKALVEEMNRYKENPEDALRMLNIKPEFDSGNRYEVKVILDGEELDEKILETKHWEGNPLQNKINIDYRAYDEDTNKTSANGLEIAHDFDWERLYFTQTDLKKIDPATGKFVFTNIEGQTLTLTKVKEKQYNYYGAF